MALILDHSNSLVAIVRGVENNGESRSSRELERRDDLFDSDLGLFLERIVEIRREILWNVHPRKVRSIDFTDLKARSDELVAKLRLAFDWIVQPGDAIGGVAGYAGDRICEEDALDYSCSDMMLCHS